MFVKGKKIHQQSVLAQVSYNNKDFKGDLQRVRLFVFWKHFVSGEMMKRKQKSL